MLESQVRVNWGAGDAVTEAAWDEYFINDEEDQDYVIQNDEVITDSSGDAFLENLQDRQSDPNSASDFQDTRLQLDPLDQHQSILFSLSYDIRALIWRYVVGGDLIHITELRNTLGHVPCMDRRHQKWRMWSHDCWVCALTVYGVHISDESYGKPEDRWNRPGSLGLLRSCQRLYADAINVLYEQTTFVMRSLGTCHSFLDSLTPERLEHVTSLHLSPIMHTNYRVWEHTWTTLARLPNLRDLRVELRGKLTERDPWAKARLLQAMCCVEQTEAYEVKVPWELEETREWLWGCPFTLEGIYGEVIESGEKEYLALLRRNMITTKDWLFPKHALLAEMCA